MIYNFIINKWFLFLLFMWVENCEAERFKPKIANFIKTPPLKKLKKVLTYSFDDNYFRSDSDTN